jgi:hypothetical protein
MSPRNNRIVTVSRLILKGGCVSDIDEEPVNFSDGSALSDEYHPVWGTCPQ